MIAILLPWYIPGPQDPVQIRQAPVLGMSSVFGFRVFSGQVALD